MGHYGDVSSLEVSGDLWGDSLGRKLIYGFLHAGKSGHGRADVVDPLADTRMTLQCRSVGR